MRLVQPTCDCPAHRRPTVQATTTKLGGWSLVLPILACAVCPACLATYAKLLSLVGVSVGMTESQHLLVLASAVLVSIVVSGVRSWRSKRSWPLAFALAGASLIAVGHSSPRWHALEWVGVLVLLVGGLREQLKLRHHYAPHTATS